MGTITRLALPGCAMLAAVGWVGHGHAEQLAAITLDHAIPVAETAQGPRFTPSEGAAFEERFAPFAGQAPIPALSNPAVDITGIEPAEEPAGRELGTGVASYYGKRFAGRSTASGERFDPQGLTAAHRTLPFGSKVRVTNASNGRSVVVRINDRGPFHGGRQIDLSRRAAEQIGLVARGHGRVEMELLAG